MSSARARADGSSSAVASTRPSRNPHAGDDAVLRAIGTPCQTLPSVRRRDVVPAGPVPDDLLTAGKQQLHGTLLRPGAPHLPRTFQMLGLPAVAQRQPDAAGAQ